ncbi:hypothetical protein F5888DRAFT_1103322 [Russula emetica]|nr:hypothetical protein F5888DRAFT_1103322 [Russula emetica]
MTVTTTSFLLHLLRLSKPTFCPHASLHRTPVSTFVRCAYSPMHNYCNPIPHSRWTPSLMPLGSQLTSLITNFRGLLLLDGYTPLSIVYTASWRQIGRHSKMHRQIRCVVRCERMISYLTHSYLPTR